MNAPVVPVEDSALCSNASEQGSRKLGSGAVVWLTGMISAGKTTIAHRVAEALETGGIRVRWLDGDLVRKQFNRDLGFSKADRDENVHRIGQIAVLLARQGVTVVVSAISPYRQARDEVRRASPIFIEVYVNASLAACEARDVKGLYRRARAGEVQHLTGVNDPYEPPPAPEVECNTEMETVAESARKVLKGVLSRLNQRERRGP